MQAQCAIRIPEGIDGGKLVKVAHDDFDTVFAGGQGPLRGQIMRFGHLGYVTEEHVRDGLIALEGALKQVGHPIPNHA